MSARTLLVAAALLLLAVAYLNPHGSASKGPYAADPTRTPGVVNPDVTQQILQRIQIDLGPEQIVSARLLPVLEEPSPNGKPEEAAVEA